jgi:hypothetical protein
MMNNKNRHYFASALTCRGLLSYWPKLFKDLKRLYLLQGNTPAGQSLVIRMLGLALEDRGLQTKYFHRAEDPMVLEGLTVPSKAVGVLSREHPYAVQVFFPPHLNVVVVKLPGDMRSAVPLIQSAGEGNGVGVDADATQAVPSEDKSRCEVKNAAEPVPSSSREHPTSDLWCQTSGFEQVVTEKAAGWIQEFQDGGRESLLQRYFAGSVTALGEVDFFNHILCHSKRRYVIKGSPGVGAEVMQGILVQALSSGYQVEAFHSWIEPKDHALLFFPEIQVAVVDLTCCYKDFSFLPDDIIWDLGKETRTADGFRKAGKKVQEIKSFLAEAGSELDASRKIQKEDLYFTEEEINKIISRILKENT